MEVKEKRKAKKTNCNKQKNLPRRDFIHNYMLNGMDKAIQMRLREEGIKVHKMDLRPIRFYAGMANNTSPFYDPEGAVGNSTQAKVVEASRLAPTCPRSIWVAH